MLFLCSCLTDLDFGWLVVQGEASIKTGGQLMYLLFCILVSGSPDAV